MNIRNWRNGLKNIVFSSRRAHSVSTVSGQNNQQPSKTIISVYNASVSLSPLLVLHCKEDLDQLGRIQRKAMRMIAGQKNMACEKRLKM